MKQTKTNKQTNKNKTTTTTKQNKNKQTKQSPQKKKTTTTKRKRKEKGIYECTYKIVCLIENENFGNALGVGLCELSGLYFRYIPHNLLHGLSYRCIWYVYCPGHHFWWQSFILTHGYWPYYLFNTRGLQG